MKEEKRGRRRERERGEMKRQGKKEHMRIIKSRRHGERK